jgi:urate oxidase
VSGPSISQRYGKERVRVLRVVRPASGVQSVYEVEASVSLEGDFADTYLTGDNSKVVATDTMKNTVHVLAQKHLGEVIEEFALALADHFLATYPEITRATIGLTQRPWERYTGAGGAPHPHTFIGHSNGLPTTKVVATRELVTIESGVREVLVLKSTASGFVGYPRSPYTTLPETDDRILATNMKATWTFTKRGVDYTKANRVIFAVLLETFAKEFSPSVQNTLYLMAQAALHAAPEITSIELAMPNKHYLGIDFKPFGLENPNEIFLPTDEPHGQIEARVSRS